MPSSRRSDVSISAKTARPLSFQTSSAIASRGNSLVLTSPYTRSGTEEHCGQGILEAYNTVGVSYSFRVLILSYHFDLVYHSSDPNLTMSAEADVKLDNFKSIFSLDGKVAVVTGGSRGLGLHAASGYVPQSSIPSAIIN